MLADACVGVLGRVFDDGRVLERELAAAFRAYPKWGKRDRSFVAETAYEVVRWRRALAWVADSGDPSSLCAAQWRRMELEIPEWWSWPGGDVAEMAAREPELGGQPRAIRESLPDWLDQRGAAELGDAWDGEIAAMNHRAPVFLRVNRLVAEVGGVLDWLADHGVEAAAVEGCPDGLVLPLGKLLPRKLAEDGRVEIQDAGSQQVAPLLEAAPGMRAIDSCAGAGGKTLHLAALMAGKGELLALDVGPRKLRELKRRARLAGVRGLKVGVWDQETDRRYAGWADRVLVDAPCSGLGTLRRQPDLKWRLAEPALEKVRRLQRRLLDHHGELVKPGGKMVYATCSILPGENRGQVANLLERDPRWTLEEELEVSPAATGWDGFYAARLRREG